jgi:hypothetical protein
MVQPNQGAIRQGCTSRSVRDEGLIGGIGGVPTASDLGCAPQGHLRNDSGFANGSQECLT